MLAIPVIIAFSFRAFDNYQFHQSILSNQRNNSQKGEDAKVLFKDDCADFLMNFKVQF